MNGRDPAAGRFAAIQLVRLAGVAMMLAGILVLSGRSPLLGNLPDLAGYLMLAAGLIAVFLVPTLLARRWRSPDPFDEAQDRT